MPCDVVPGEAVPTPLRVVKALHCRDGGETPNQSTAARIWKLEDQRVNSGLHCYTPNFGLRPHLKR